MNRHYFNGCDLLGTIIKAKNTYNNTIYHECAEGKRKTCNGGMYVVNICNIEI